jgi:hypothetical protein
MATSRRGFIQGAAALGAAVMSADWFGSRRSMKDESTITDRWKDGLA